MKREIKFRIWDSISKKWNSSRNYPFENIYGNGYRLEPITGDKIQQFTGLLDKKGKEIYEGDIVKFDIEQNESDFREIVFDSGYFGLKREAMRPALLYPLEVEIVGNIFENPELLNEQNN